MTKATKKYDVTQCALYKCQTKRRLEQLLLLKPGQLKLVNEKIQYHQFEIDKRHSNEKRRINAPNRELKKIQSRILYLLQKVIRPDWLISGEKGKCYIDNGKIHLNGRFLLAMDIRKFYDNCSREPVYRFFIQKMKTSPDVAQILTDIVTFEAGIPTGCPTSQMIAFYAYMDMFIEINEVAKSKGCRFSLYVDDMTFSSSEPFDPQRLGREIDLILRKYGHKPKYSKMKYYSADDYKPVTGTIITPDQMLVAPNKLQATIYQGFQDIKYVAGKTTCTADEAKRITTLNGQVQAARNIEQRKFPEILRIVQGMPKPASKAMAKKTS